MEVGTFGWGDWGDEKEGEGTCFFFCVWFVFFFVEGCASVRGQRVFWCGAESIPEGDRMCSVVLRILFSWVFGVVGFLGEGCEGWGFWGEGSGTGREE